MRFTSVVDAATLNLTVAALARWAALMIGPPAGVRVWLATGYADIRKCIPSLVLQVQHFCIAIRSAAICSGSASSRQSVEGELA
jgi:hypothetical protein